MGSLLRALKNTIRHTRPPRREISSLPQILPTDTPIEEETVPYYKPAHYYPVRIGDVYHARYRSLANSAMERTQRVGYVETSILKVSTSLPDFPSTTDRELRVYEHLSKVDSTHLGQSLIRELYDSFDLQGPGGNHRCLVLQPMHMTLLDMMGMNPKPFDLPLLKMTITRLLSALDFLHTEAGVVHTDLKTDNLMLSLEDDSMLADFAMAEAETPSARKMIDESRIIYSSRKFRLPRQGTSFGLPTLCDFDEARIGATHESGPFVQPHIYRAPEIIFEMPWGAPVDIWNLAGLIWDLFEGEHLFKDMFSPKGRHDAFKHLALMVALVGAPPSEFVQRSDTTEQCFDSTGTWNAHTMEPIPTISLETLEKRLSGDEKELFLAFLRSMLKWLPEERLTAKQLLDHPFLH